MNCIILHYFEELTYTSEKPNQVLELYEFRNKYNDECKKKNVLECQYDLITKFKLNEIKNKNG